MQPKEKLTEDVKREIEKRVHRSACFQRVFKGADGELTLDEIDKFTKYKTDTFDPDPYINAYQAGRRSVAVFVHNVIDQDIEKVKSILEKEQK